MDGVVVAQEDVRTLIDGYKQIEAAKEEKAIAKRRKAALGRWRLLVGTWATRVRLQREADGGGAAAAEHGGDDDEVEPAGKKGRPPAGDDVEEM